MVLLPFIYFERSFKTLMILLPILSFKVILLEMLVVDLIAMPYTFHCHFEQKEIPLSTFLFQVS